jgi:hypothetical protein
MLVVAALLATSPAAAADWSIVRVTGEAWIATANEPPVRAIVGLTVPDRGTFSTAANARARLERGAEVIFVGPNTILSPRQSTIFGSTTIVQQVGRIRLNVERRFARSFSVETPFLNAAGTATEFTVTVTARTADVQVMRGTVHVSDAKSGEAADVRSGQKAVVDANGRQGLQVGASGRQPEGRPSPSRAGPAEATGNLGATGAADKSKSGASEGEDAETASGAGKDTSNTEGGHAEGRGGSDKGSDRGGGSEKGGDRGGGSDKGDSSKGDSGKGGSDKGDSSKGDSDKGGSDKGGSDKGGGHP